MTDQAADGSSICIGCGLCCDGTMFVRGKLTAEAASRTPACHKFMGGSDGDESL